MTPEELTRLLEELQAEIDAASPVATLQDDVASSHRGVAALRLREVEPIVEIDRLSDDPLTLEVSGLRHRR
jgi:hypothetical protein